jgi:hypothetical protein
VPYHDHHQTSVYVCLCVCVRLYVFPHIN